MLAAEPNPVRLMIALVILVLLLVGGLFVFTLFIAYSRGLFGFYNDNITKVIKRRGRWRQDLTVNPSSEARRRSLWGNLFYRFPFFTEEVDVERRWDTIHTGNLSVAVAGFSFSYDVQADYQIVDAFQFVQAVDSDGVSDSETVQQSLKDLACRLLQQYSNDRVGNGVMNITDPALLNNAFLEGLKLQDYVNEHAGARGVRFRDVKVVNWTPSKEYGLFLAAREFGVSFRPPRL